VLTQQLASCFKNVLNGPRMSLSRGCKLLYCDTVRSTLLTPPFPVFWCVKLFCPQFQLPRGLNPKRIEYLQDALKSAD
jgi:hypothetical protein